MKTKFTIMQCASVMLFMAVSTAFADDEPITGIWKGGSTQFLANPNNWVGGVVPGRVRETVDGVVVTNGAWGCTMVFDGRSTWPNDLRTSSNTGHGSLVSTWKMVFKGASLIQNYFYNYQTFRIEAGGGIYVEEDAGHVPYFQSPDCGFEIFNASSAERTVTIRNDSTLAPFKFNRIGYASGMRAPGYLDQPVLRLEGKGDIEFNGLIWENSGAYVIDIAQEGSAKTLFTSTSTEMTKIHRLLVRGGATKRTIRLDGKSTIATRAHGENAIAFVVESDLDVLGAGRLYIGYPWPFRSNIQIASGKTLFFDATLRNYGIDSACTVPVGLGILGGGKMIMGENATNRVTGAVTVAEGSSLQVGAIGMAGASSPLGTGSSVSLVGGSSLVYTGTGETSDRTFSLGSGGGSLVHAGTGSLTVGAVSMSADSSLVVSNNATLVMSSLSRTAGSLDVRSFGTGKAVFSGLSVGRAPEWLTLNGERAKIAADHTLVGPAGIILTVR